MCVTQLLATEVSLTQAEIKSATAQGSYANCSVTSTSGTWAGKMIINKTTGYVQINKNKNNYYLGSPTFSGGVTKVVITTCNSTASGRMFYLCANTNTAQPNSGIYGSGSTSSSNGTATITVTGSPTSFYIYSNGAAYISSVTVTYSGNSPSITKSGTLTAFTATYGSASDEQNFTVGGSKLTADISVTAPANYEISKTSGSGFGSSVTLTKDGSGNVTNTTLYIRLKDNIDAGSVDATTITCTSAGATDQTISIPASKVQSKVNWLVNGSSAAGSPTLAVDKAGNVTTLPTEPTSSDCDGSKVFVGWTDAAIASPTNTKPSTLFTAASGAPAVNVNEVTYYAVFAKSSGRAETLLETVGFESSEGYTAGTTYNSNNYTTGSKGSKWKINYGAFSTNNAIIDNQSAQFRIYSSGGGYGALMNTGAYSSDITKVAFSAKTANSNGKVKVSYSTNGSDWIDITTQSLASTTKEYTVEVPVSGVKYIKFTAAGTRPSKSNYSIFVDAVKLYNGGSTYTDD